MRQTFQSSFAPIDQQTNRDHPLAASVRLHQHVNIEANPLLSPETFLFKNPTDLGSYIKERHPGLVS